MTSTELQHAEPKTLGAQIPFMDLRSQYLTIKPDVDAAIQRVLQKSDFIMGEDVRNFEKAFSEYMQVQHTIGCSNGTSALEMALLVLGIGAGDEVITTPHTFFATVEAILSVGAKPVFVDIDPVTYNIDIQKIEQAITKRTKAIVPVHLYGQCADMSAILAIAQKHSLKVIEDAAQAHGATHMQKPAGSMGDMGTFSFYPGKNLGAYGDAGAIVTQNSEWASHLRLLINHGRTDKYTHLIPGYNHRMDTLQAAVLNVKMKHIEKWTQRRIQLAQLYTDNLRDLPVQTPTETVNSRHVFHLYVIRCDNRDGLRQYLAGRGIETGIHYPLPLHLQPAFRGFGFSAGDFPETEKAAQEILSLPLCAEISEEKVLRVVAAMRDFWSMGGRA